MLKMDLTINLAVLCDSWNAEPVSMGILLDTREMTSATEWASTKDSTVPSKMPKEADFFQA